MRIVIVGPGRAGMSLAIAATAAEHDVVAVVGRSLDSAALGAEMVDATPLTIGSDLPIADLLIIATRDDAIAAVAKGIADKVGNTRSAVHISGLTPVAALASLADQGLQVGSFHPLQTLPTPEAGAARLSGAYVAVTADAPLQEQLEAFARDLGATPFRLDDHAKATYHAAAAAAANFPLATFAMASDLFAAAGVPWEAARPLVEAVVANAFDLGPRAALTGPVARGDVDTVAAQLRAVDMNAPQWRAAFAEMVALVANIAGRTEQFESVLDNEEDEK